MTIYVMEFPLPTTGFYIFIFVFNFFIMLSLCPLCIVYVSISMQSYGNSSLHVSILYTWRHMSAAVTIRLYGYRHVHVKQ